MVLLVVEYQMTRLKEDIEKYLLQQDLSVEKLVLADRCGLTDLRKACLEHAKKGQSQDWTSRYKTAYDKLEPPRDFRCHHCNTQQIMDAGNEEEIDFTKPWDLSDITFIVEGQKVYANKTLLSLSSPVMKAMLKADFRENDVWEIELSEKELEPFLDLMNIVHQPNQFKGNKVTT